MVGDVSGGGLVVICGGVFQTPHPRFLNGPEDEGAGTTFGGPEEALMEELCRPFMFGFYAIGHHGVGRNCWVVCLNWCVEAVEGASSVG